MRQYRQYQGQYNEQHHPPEPDHADAELATLNDLQQMLLENSQLEDPEYQPFPAQCPLPQMQPMEMDMQPELPIQNKELLAAEQPVDIEMPDAAPIAKETFHYFHANSGRQRRENKKAYQRVARQQQPDETVQTRSAQGRSAVPVDKLLQLQLQHGHTQQPAVHMQQPQQRVARVNAIQLLPTPNAAGGEGTEADPRWMPQQPFQSFPQPLQQAHPMHPYQFMQQQMHPLQFLQWMNAARAMSLLEDDAEHRRCLRDAVVVHMPAQIRQLFATLILCQTPRNIDALFIEFQEDMAEDYIRHNLLQDPNATFQQQHIHMCLADIQRNLQIQGKSLKHFCEMPQLPADYAQPRQDLWFQFQRFRLITNMRAVQDDTYQAFSDWLPE
eukprot:gene1081-biopygen305